MKRVLYNAIRTPDGTVIVSTNRHDFVSHTDANGRYYAVDGGSDYSRRVFDQMDYTDISVHDDGEWSTRREYLVWGNNYDKDMNRLLETEWILIKDLATDHIEAILDGGYCKDEMYLETFNEELKNREDGGETKS
jgi:hypothetical protein